MKLLSLAAFGLACVTLAGCDGVVDLLPDTPAEPPSAESAAMLAAVNRHRAEGRDCGGTYYGPAEPLVWNGRLGSAATAHARDMAAHEHFDHVGTDGSTVGDRVSRAGYAWRRVGENIARYQDSVEEVVGDWVASAGHCANLMNPSYVEFGAAEEDLYWTQVFARPR
jgi:uncharacterized protein YkwD